MEKVYEILKSKNMLVKKLMPYCTFGDVLRMNENERPVRRINDDLVFYATHFSDIEDISRFKRKKYKALKGEKYLLIKHQVTPDYIIIEEPKFIIQNYYNDGKAQILVSEDSKEEFKF